MAARQVIFSLFRHGETDWNAEGRFQGHLDIPLNDRGREQARELALNLRDHRLQAILSSDLGRAIETAEIVASSLGFDASALFKDPGIKEAFLGQAQGLTVSEIRERFGEELLDRWKSNQVSDADVSYPDGEKAQQVVSRSMKTLRDFALSHPEFARIGVATHGGVIRRIMHQVLNFPAARVPIPNGVVYRVQCVLAQRSPELDVWSCLDRPSE